MRIAVIADTHGNLLALTAVLGHIAAAAPDLIVNLGDLVSGPFDPAGSADAQMQLGCPTVRGNHDRWVAHNPTGRIDVAAWATLSAAHLAWLGGLPPMLTLAGGEILACHGSPVWGDNTYLLEDVGSGAPVLATDAAIRAGLGDIGAARLVLCAHSHIARAVSVGDVLVVNPGSVGWPAYADREPVPHRMEAGSPHARYAMVTRGRSGWSASLCAVPYDWEAAARQAAQSGRADVAYAVRTGRQQEK
jgi:predicted phosphodiesterase